MTYYSPISNSFNLGRVFFSLKFYDIYSFLRDTYKKGVQKISFFSEPVDIKKMWKDLISTYFKKAGFPIFF